MATETDNEMHSEPMEDQTMGPYRDVYVQDLMEQQLAAREQAANEAAAKTEPEVEEGPERPVWEVDELDDDSPTLPRQSRKAALVAALLKAVPDDE